jgi:hypothetical protein
MSEKTKFWLLLSLLIMSLGLLYFVNSDMSHVLTTQFK